MRSLWIKTTLHLEGSGARSGSSSPSAHGRRTQILWPTTLLHATATVSPAERSMDMDGKEENGEEDSEWWTASGGGGRWEEAVLPASTGLACLQPPHIDYRGGETKLGLGYASV